MEKETPKYPSRYVQILVDGYRIGERGEPITFDQDWFALGTIIFETCYKLTDPGSGNVDDTLRRFAIRNNIPQEFNAKKADFSTLQGGAYMFLRNYLEQVSDSGFAFNLVNSFSQSLDDCNLV